MSSVHEASDMLPSIFMGRTEGVSFDDALELFEGADGSGLEDLNAEYLNFQEGSIYNFVATEIYNTMLDGKNVDVVKLYEKGGRTCISGATVLVSAAKRLKQLPAFMRVEVKGKKKSAAGSYFDLSIKTYPISQ